MFLNNYLGTYLGTAQYASNFQRVRAVNAYWVLQWPVIESLSAHLHAGPPFILFFLSISSISADYYPSSPRSPVSYTVCCTVLGTRYICSRLAVDLVWLYLHFNAQFICNMTSIGNVGSLMMNHTQLHVQKAVDYVTSINVNQNMQICICAITFGSVKLKA